MTNPQNPYFARSYVNRLWGYLLGVGLIEPIDDIRAGNPPTNPELLDYLTQSFVDSGFDTRSILRMICNSRTYQLDVAPNVLNADDKINYSHALPRRLPAEVIYDTVHKLTGSVSEIPGVPKGTRAAALGDSGINLADGFLTNLGRPARESACECERSSGLQLGPVMALISGPTIGSAISDTKNELANIVASTESDQEVAEEIFLRALSRHPSPQEVQAFESILNQIRFDNERIAGQLAEAESAWVTRREILEKERLESLAATKQQAAARSEEIKPERERLEKERQERIAAANTALDAQIAGIPGKVDSFLESNANKVQWYTMMPVTAESNLGLVLAPQADRSILARGDKKDKGIYTLTFKSKLPKISGLRLEALADPLLPAQGPGLAGNGNFVLTELVVKAGKAANPKELTDRKIASGKADFLQEGFAIEQTFDGQTRDQQGWAVSGSLGQTHWATFKFAEPIVVDGESVISIELHQFHNAADHRLGRFRISFTMDEAEAFPLSLPEPFEAIAGVAKNNRNEAEAKQITDYLLASDKEVAGKRNALAEANRPVPPDEMLTQLEARVKTLDRPTVDDPALVQLRQDAQQSASQIQNIRVTAAEDLTWALVNSPAFLFNH
jgi:hypothetical protein